MEVSWNKGTPCLSSILVGFSLTNHGWFRGTPIDGNLHITLYVSGVGIDVPMFHITQLII